MNPHNSERIIFTFLSKVQEQSVHGGKNKNNLTNKNKSVPQEEEKNRKMATTEHHCYSSISNKIEKLMKRMNNKRPSLWGEEDQP